MFGGTLQPDVADARAPAFRAVGVVTEAAAAPPSTLTHVDSEGKLRMVDVGSKPHTQVRSKRRACRACV